MNGPRARRGGRVVAMLTLVALFAAVVAFVAFGQLLNRPYRGWDGETIEVPLEAGLGAGAMLERLGRAGVVRHPRLLRAWLTVVGGGERLHAGEYRFAAPVSPREVLDRLRRGDVLLHAVTLPEGLTLAEVVRRLATAGFGEEAALERALRDPAPIAELDPLATDLEGYLFPDTYHFPRDTSAERIAAALVARFKEVTGPGYAQGAAAVGLDLRKAVTLASLIERETGVSGERARVSRVFHNRLARGMRLECDPTVLYALERAGRSVERLTYAHLRFESPWNTYHAHGLPPGPIANPGRASLEAAIAPADGDELFFVAAPDGGHRFSVDLAGHLRAVAAWRRHQESAR